MKFNLKETDLFDSYDLFDMKNFGKVSINMFLSEKSLIYHRRKHMLVHNQDFFSDSHLKVVHQ